MSKLAVAEFTVRLVPKDETPDDNETWDRALKAWEDYGYASYIKKLFGYVQRHDPDIQGFELEIEEKKE